MKIQTQTPIKALNKAFLKHRPLRSEIDIFKKNLLILLGKIDEIEREENQKNHIRDFLLNTYYSGKYEINTKGTIDLAIHRGNSGKENVGVIIEAKRPSARAEMVSAAEPNAKALQELVLYFMRERIDEKNPDVKYLIATNIKEWYIFDGADFNRLFIENKAFVKQYEEWRDGMKMKADTALFYNEVAKPYIKSLDEEIPCTYFHLGEYEKYLLEGNSEEDNNLIALQKILSPNHLLTVPFADDSNSLNETFYRELLHIIGLEEVKDGSKKIIRRKAEGRQPGSLIENAINILETEDSLNKIPGLANFGEDKEKQLFNIALELSITWINRILFLKLLEGQLLAYHKGDEKQNEFRFLDTSRIQDYDELYKLFHQVLALDYGDRKDAIIKKFGLVPYLNSSLFEISELENLTIKINSLGDNEPIEIMKGSVLNGVHNPRPPKNPLDYLCRFLDAYDFASEGAEDIEEDNKTLINASVLGKVFEKINGYKDGSFFTPGFITMYMCRETIRRAVVQKFNDYFKKEGMSEAADFTRLYNKIDRIDIKKANEIVNSLRLCDTAVGSGHFLVSALNEIIYIKYELGILVCKDGRRLKDYEISVENDELILSDEKGIFAYNFRNKESRRVQETIFHEKLTIIENCLFGVDINPKSVMICRLRLWIELLKNAYYRVAPQNVETQHAASPTAPQNQPYRETLRATSLQEPRLETLPNIDINIKCGNSLISRFSLTEPMFSIQDRRKLDQYKDAVYAYKNATSKDSRNELKQLIEKLKGEFKGFGAEGKSAKEKKEAETAEKLQTLLASRGFAGLSPKEEKQKEKLEKELAKLAKEIEEEKAANIFGNAFEWRFEFPEVLDGDGEFAGFDVVITNPPYVFARENFSQIVKDYYTVNFKTSQYQINLFFLFIEKTFTLLRAKGVFSLIVPNSLLMVSSARTLRNHILTETSLYEIINLMGYSFEGVNVETIIISGKIEKNNIDNQISIYSNDGHDFVLNHRKSQTIYMSNEGSELNVFSNEESDGIIEKINKNSDILDKLVAIKAGLQAYESGKGIPKQSSDDVKKRIYDYKYKFDDNTFEYLEGKDVCRYFYKWEGNYLRYGNNLASPRKIELFKGKKIIIREITGKHPQSIIATYTEDLVLFNRSNIAIIEYEKSDIDLKYILGLLNSKLLSYYFIKNTAKSVRQMFPKLILEDLRKFPIKNISEQEQKPFIDLVNQILSAKQSDPQADTSALEAEIDRLVYELYGLTEEEISIVEGRGKL